MPRITLDIFARLHERNLRNLEKEAVGRFQKIGQKSADELVQGVEKATPRIRRAMHSAADAAGDYARKTDALKKAQRDQAEVAKEAVRLEGEIAERRARSGLATNATAQRERDLTKARGEQEKAARDLLEWEGLVDDMRQNHVETTNRLSNEELQLKKMRLEGQRAAAKQRELELLPLRQKKIDEAKDLKDAEVELAKARESLTQTTYDAKKSEDDLSSVKKEHEQNNKDLVSSEDNLAKSRQTIKKIDEDLVRINEDVSKSNRKREESLRRLVETEMDQEKRSSGGGRGGRRSRSGAGVIGNMLTDLPFVPSGPAGAAIGGGMLVGLASAAQAAVTASQSIGALPAVVAAAAAGFGTLALATAGFGDAIKNMGDPDKFATALQSLSPAAQQAALEIQYLVQGPLRDLKSAAQESLFSGVAEQLHNLTNEFLPEINQLTTGVAGSFNNMFGNAIGQLMTPETSASINTTINNIVTAFQHLEPAVAPFIDALTKIIETGSTFLPGFADAITNAAKSFSAFITEAQANGSLHEFIQKGIDAAVTLGHIIWDLGKKIFEVFGNKDPAEFKQTLDSMVQAAMSVVQAIVGISHVVNDLLKVIQPVADALGGWDGLIHGATLAFVGFKFVGIATALEMSAAFTTAGTAAGVGFAGKLAAGLKGFGWAAVGAAIAVPILGALDKKVQEWVADHNGEPIPKKQRDRLIPNTVPILPFWEDQFRNIFGDDDSPPGAPPPGSPGGRQPVPGTNEWFDPGKLSRGSLDGVHGTDGSMGPGSPTAGLDPYHLFDVPQPTPKDPDGSKITDKERRDRIRAQLDPNSFMPDMGSLPSAPAIGQQPTGTPAIGGPPGATPPLQYGTNGDPYAKPGYGYTDVDPRQVSDSQYKMQQQARDVRDARLDLAVLEKDNLATQEELLLAREKVADQEHEFQDAQLDYQDALSGKWKKVGKGMADSMGEIGAHLDKDLGLSKGLAGLADNLVRFLGNLATAPIQQMLQNVIDAHPNEGSGLVGILAAQGAFGPQFTPEGIAAGGGISGNGSLLSNGADSLVRGQPLGGGGAPGTALPGESARDFAHRVEMPFWQSQGYQVGDHAADQHGEHQNGAIDIMVPNIAEGNKVLQQVLSDPNVYGAIFNNQTYGYGHGTTPQPYGSTGGPTDKHEDHVHAWYQPGRSGDITPLPGGVGAPMSAPMSFGGPGGGSGVVPVFVTNMGGGGTFGPGAPMGTPASGQGVGAPPGPGTGLNFDALADSESGTPGVPGSANWANKSNPKYKGGLQFDQGTWNDFRPPGAPDNPADATKEQQIAAAQNALSQGRTPQSLWPQNYGKLGMPASAPTGGTGFPLPTSPVNPFGTPGLPDVSGTVRVPGGATSEPNSQSGIQSPLGTPQILAPPYPGTTPSAAPYPGMPWPAPQFPAGGSPFGAPDVSGVGTPAPGSIGPFPVPPSVAATQGSLGASAVTPLTSGTAATGASGWAPPSPPGGTGYQPTPQPQAAPGWQPGAKSSGGGGIIGAAAGAAAGMFPGGGAAAQIAMQMIQRTIQYGGEVAGALVQGGLDTLSVSDPDGGPGASLNDSWLGRLGGALASAAPALPSTAGKADQSAQQAQQQQGAQGQQQPGQGQGNNGPLIGTMNVQADKATGQHMANEMAYASAASGMTMPVI